MKFKVSQLLNITILIVGVAIFIFFLSKQEIFIRAGYALNDILTHRFQYAENNHSDSVVIIKIDDKTLDGLGRSDLGILSFDKGVYGQVIEKLFSDYNVAGIGVDVVFANPSVLGIEDELALKYVLDRYVDQVVIATFSSTNPSPLCLYSSSMHGFVDSPDQEVVRYFHTLGPDYPLLDKCGSTDIHPYNLGAINSLGAQLLQASIPHLSPFKRDELRTNLDLFLGRDKSYHIAYFANGHTNDGTIGFRSYSLIDILEGKSIDLSGRMILIGEVGTAIHDSHFTPISPSVRMPGVEIHANIIETMYQGIILRDLNPWIFYVLKFFLGAIVLALVFLMRIIYSILGIFILCIGLLFMSVGLFIVSGIFLQTLHLLSFAILLYIFLYLYRFTVTDKLKRELKKQFSLYVSPDVVNDITKNPESVILKGERRDMTMFFSDIENFTSLSESLDTQDIIELLNEYFKEMTQIFQLNKGTLDKYIGDGLMGFFGAPIATLKHSYDGCKTALEQQQKLRELRNSWGEKGYKNIRMRIGIHSGEAIHGNIGSSDTRVSYTIIGDNVNIASRLESICKEYGVSICVSHEVYQREKENFYFRELDEIKLKGKNDAIKIYELIDFKDKEISELDMKKYGVYRKGLDLYRLGKIQEAYTIWSKNTDDLTSLCMAERCRQISLGNASITNGVYVMTHK